jgi:ADP-ribose pyrophosphatase YjhB (NUDIX family)
MPAVQATAGVAAVEAGRVLLVRRADDGSWCLPGGKVEVGEVLEACAAREFAEETGLAVELGGLLGLYSDPAQQTHRYPDGAVVQFVAVVFEGRAGGEVGPLAGDTTEVAWFAWSELPQPIMGTDAPIIRDALSDRPRPIVS